jgi:long-chain acyl-CoA synthetase
MLLGTALTEAARRTPAAEAIVDGPRRWTYAQWNAEVNRVAHGLQHVGIGVGDRVACSLTNRVELLTAMFAAQKLGALAVPLNFRLTPAELDVIAADCTPRAWCFESLTAPMLAETAAARDGGIEWIACDPDSPFAARPYAELLRGADSEPAEPRIAERDASLIMYTSGTTGKPKGVVLSHHAQFVNSLLMLAELGLTAAERTLHIAPLYHVAAYHVIALPLLLTGGVNVLVRRYSADTVASHIEREGITSVLGAPTHFELWAAHGRLPGDSARQRLRSAYITGAPARAETVAWIRERLTPGLWNVYGQTEASSLITLLPPAEMHRMGALNCIGRNVIGMETRIVSPGEDYRSGGTEPDIGELVARGDKLMTHYYGAPEKTAAKLRNGWLHTGDLVQRDADGYYYLIGRADDLIITGGENVYPLEIEQVLVEAPGVADCAVVGVPDPVWGQVIAAFLVPEGKTCDVRAVARLAENRLATHKRPRRWAVIDAVPRNPSGKVLLRELRSRAAMLRDIAEIE